MYGISDIRGSSTERNKAIQKDLLEQFNLGLNIVKAVTEEKNIPFLEQLKLDLENYIEKLTKEIQVEDEITAIQYIREHLETYFDYFIQSGIKAEQEFNKNADLLRENARHNIFNQYSGVGLTSSQSLGETPSLKIGEAGALTGYSSGLVPSYLNALTPYQNNRNMQLQANMQTAQNKANIMSSLFKGVGQVAGMGLGAYIGGR